MQNPREDLVQRLVTSSQDVARPTSNSFSDAPGIQAKASSGRATSSPELSNTKTQ